MTTATSINDKFINAISTKADSSNTASYKTNDSDGFNKILDNLQQTSREVENKVVLDHFSKDDNKYLKKHEVRSKSNDRIPGTDHSDKYKKADNSIGSKREVKNEHNNEPQKDDVKQTKDTKADNTTSLQVQDKVSDKETNAAQVSSKEDVKQDTVQNSAQDVNAVNDQTSTEIATQNTDQASTTNIDSQTTNKTSATDVETAKVNTDATISKNDLSVLNTEALKEVLNIVDTISTSSIDGSTTDISVGTTGSTSTQSTNTSASTDLKSVVNQSASLDILETESNKTSSKSPTNNGNIKPEINNNTLANQADSDKTTLNSLTKGSSNSEEVVKDILNNALHSDKLDEKVKSTEIKTEIKVNEKTDIKVDIIDESNKLQIKVSEPSDVKNTKNIDSKIFDDLKDKTILKQNIIDELNAEVNNSKKDSFNNSLLTKQNASEQVIKLSISNSLTNTNNTEFSNIINQQNFSLNNADKSSMTTTQAQTVPSDISKVDILSQINDKLNSLKTSTGNKIEIILRPENLGKVNVELQSNKGQITATLVAENASVKESLEKSIETLKNNLSNHGVQVSNVIVKVEDSEKSSLNNLNLAQEQFEDGLKHQQQKNSQTSNSRDYGNSVLGDMDSELESEDVTDINNELDLQKPQKAGLVDYKV